MGPKTTISPEMKTSTESVSETTKDAGQTQSIICGGGWKTPTKQYHVKIKAICGAFLTIVAAVSGIGYYATFGWLGFVPTGVLLIPTTLLFWFERPSTFLGLQDGDHDPRNLYAQSGVWGEKHSSEQSDDHKHFRKTNV